MTGNATTTDEQCYAEAGFTCTLGKPFSLEDLRSALQRHVVLPGARTPA